MTSPLKTPLYQAHIGLGARMVDFHGWLMPMRYTSIDAEARAVRENAGIFDITHMGEAEVKGAHALELLQFLTSNDLSVIEEGQAQYTTLLNDDGGIIDDLVVYRVSGERFFLCLNAANTDTDVNWIADQALQYPDVEVRNLSRHYGLLAVQGPNSEPLLNQVTNCKLSKIDYYHFVTTLIEGHNAIISRTGYTGEDGFEIFLEWRETAAVWKQIMNRGKSFGVKPIGLGARDALRLEMGYPLHGQDITAETTPIEAGLDWIVKLAKEDGFCGCDVLAKQKREGVKRKMVGFELEGRGVPRQGHPILSRGERVGEVTSGTVSPMLGTAIGMGYVRADLSDVGARLQIDIRGRMVEAVVRARPFIESHVKKRAAAG